MPTSVSIYSNATRPSASGNSGLSIFNSDSKQYQISDGTNWYGFDYDGIIFDFSGSNSYSGVFDGAGDWITIGGISELNSTSTLSFSTWFKLTAAPVQETFFGGGSTTSSRMWSQVLSSTSFRVGIDSTFKDLTLSTTLNTTDWYHYAFVYNAGTISHYLDGSLQGSTAGSPTTTSATNTNNLRLGALTGDGAFNNNTTEFQGKMDEIAFFDYALSSSDVSSIYNNKFYNSPIALWRLENDVTDATGNYDGTNSNVTFDASDKPY